jgi:hypothetical protein
MARVGVEGRMKRTLSYLPGVLGGGCCSLNEWRRLSRSLRRFSSPLPSLWYAASDLSRVRDGLEMAAGRSSLSHRVSVPGLDSCPSVRLLQQKPMMVITSLGNVNNTDPLLGNGGLEVMYRSSVLTVTEIWSWDPDGASHQQ